MTKVTSLQPDTMLDNAPVCRIRRIDAVRVKLPLIKPMIMVGMHIVYADNVLVRIESDDGTVGWGEATVAPTMTGDFAEGIVAAIEYLAPALVGQPVGRHAALARHCLSTIHGNTGAKSALDMALVDLVGRRLGVPAVELLGGRVRDRAQAMWLLGNASVDEDVEEAKERYAEGFTFFKLKVGVKPLDQDVALAHALRRELGPDLILCADANMGFSPANARRFLAEADGAGLLYLEQPLDSENLAGMHMLSGLGLAPICADEGIIGAPEILAHQRAGAAAGVNLKLMKAGGPRAAARLSALCEAIGFSVTVAGKVAETSVSTASTLAVACVSANLDWGLNLTHIYLAEDVVRRPLELDRGWFSLPAGPGSGVEVDELVVERYRVS